MSQLVQLVVRKILSNLFDLQLDVTYIYCDNQSCVKLSENPMFHDKSKHIEIKYHYIRDMFQIPVVTLEYVVTNELLANVLTKPLVRAKSKSLKEFWGLKWAS